MSYLISVTINDDGSATTTTSGGPPVGDYFISGHPASAETPHHVAALATPFASITANFVVSHPDPDVKVVPVET